MKKCVNHIIYFFNGTGGTQKKCCVPPNVPPNLLIILFLYQVVQVVHYFKHLISIRLFLVQIKQHVYIKGSFRSNLKGLYRKGVPSVPLVHNCMIINKLGGFLVVHSVFFLYHQKLIH